MRPEMSWKCMASRVHLSMPTRAAPVHRPGHSALGNHGWTAMQQPVGTCSQFSARKQ